MKQHFRLPNRSLVKYHSPFTIDTISRPRWRMDPLNDDRLTQSGPDNAQRTVYPCSVSNYDPNLIPLDRSGHWVPVSTIWDWTREESGWVFEGEVSGCSDRAFFLCLYPCGTWRNPGLDEYLVFCCLGFRGLPGLSTEYTPAVHCLAGRVECGVKTKRVSEVGHWCSRPD